MNLHKQWSMKYTRQFVFFSVFLVLILVMAMFMLTAGMRCIDLNGCLRSHCPIGKFADSY